MRKALAEDRAQIRLFQQATLATSDVNFVRWSCYPLEFQGSWRCVTYDYVNLDNGNNDG